VKGSSEDEDTTPTTLVEPEQALLQTTLQELPQGMQEAANRAGWTQLMPVQARAIPYLLARRDLMVQSRTGSGKTGAFMLPILERIDLDKAACQALVLVPTRELARQVATDAQLLAGPAGARIIAVYGGVSYGPQLEAFRAGAHVVVGTPGRILDHLLRRSLSLDDLQILVFDEADRMLSMGFYPDMRQVQRYLPRHRLNSYMFSATFPPQVMRLADQFLRDPQMLSLSRDRVHVMETEHVFYVVPRMDKDRSLVRIIEVENPASAIIFCNTRTKVDYVVTVLQRFGYDADRISSDLSQKDREKVMARIRKGKLRFLVATDVAARGIDLPELSHVIIYEPPEDPEDYIHRAGRTGRAGASGEAISLVDVLERTQLKRIAARYKVDFQERELPSDQDVANVVAQRVTVLLEASLRGRDRVEAERLQRFVPLGQALAESEDELPLIAMLLDDFYQQSLRRPEEQPAGTSTDEPTPKARKGAQGRRRSGRKRRRPSQ
jgi:ATP-dependent RNA helicase DeaD